MAEAVAEGLREAGVEVDLFNPLRRGTVRHHPVSARCAATARRLARLTLRQLCRGNLKQFVDDHYIADVRKGMQGLKGKPYALFCSHGGGGRVREVMVSLFKRIGTQVGKVVASRGYPSPGVLERCRALGKALDGTVLQ
jgi:hypothetical protein